MAITSYADLKAKVADYLSRSDLTSQIEDFITGAEIRLRRELRIREALKVVTASTTIGDSTLGLPSDYNMMRDLHLVSNPVGVLEYMSPSAFYNNTNSVISGQPRQYTILAQEIQFAPIPDSVYTVQMLYYAQPPFLSSTNSSNIFLAVCPDLLLYGALGEAEPYLMNDGRLQTWATLYERGLSALSISDDEGEYSGAPLTVKISPR
jgi:hypothetical protein